MNIYDNLNNLVKSIETSEEFLRYKQAAAAVDANPTYAQMAKDFITVQVQISTMQMLGQQPGSELIERFNTLYTSVSAIACVNEFIQAQMQFSRIMEDVSKALSKAATLEYDFMKILPDQD
ncbi:MAG: YlbF family regulator [Anaerofustis sp.]